jgi:hypothetical protein
MNLFDVNDVYERLLLEAEEYASEHEGVYPDDLAMRLDTVELERNKKIESYGHAYKNRLAMAKAIESEIKRMEKRKKSLMNACEFLKSVLAAVVPSGEKIQMPTLVIGWRKFESVEIIDAAVIPIDYTRIIPERHEPDKVMIKDLLKKGTAVPGTELVTKNNIQIK